MVRGRKANLDLPLTPALQQQREFREKRANLIKSLQDENAQLRSDNTDLQKRNDELQSRLDDMALRVEWQEREIRYMGQALQRHGYGCVAEQGQGECRVQVGMRGEGEQGKEPLEITKGGAADVGGRHRELNGPAAREAKKGCCRRPDSSVVPDLVQGQVDAATGGTAENLLALPVGPVSDYAEARYSLAPPPPPPPPPPSLLHPQALASRKRARSRSPSPNATHHYSAPGRPAGPPLAEAPTSSSHPRWRLDQPALHPPLVPASDVSSLASHDNVRSRASTAIHTPSSPILTPALRQPFQEDVCCMGIVSCEPDAYADPET